MTDKLWKIENDNRGGAWLDTIFGTHVGGVPWQENELS